MNTSESITMVGSTAFRSGLPEEPQNPFDSLASAYDAWFEEEGKLVFPTEVQALRELLTLLSRPWLEVGVGSGRFAQALGIEVGLDPSIRLLQMARDRGVNSLLGRGEAVPFATGSFGTVFLIVTLCFVDSPLQVLTEANRILRSDGNVVIGLVLRESPWGQFYQLKKAEGHRFYKYAAFYSYHEVATLLRQAGFQPGKMVSTLFQMPSRVDRLELAQEGYSPDAGFVAIMASKSGTLEG